MNNSFNAVIYWYFCTAKAYCNIVTYAICDNVCDLEKRKKRTNGMASRVVPYPLARIIYRYMDRQSGRRDR
jgi:hypothetical protein